MMRILAKMERVHGASDDADTAEIDRKLNVSFGLRSGAQIE